MRNLNLLVVPAVLVLGACGSSEGTDVAGTQGKEETATEANAEAAPVADVAGAGEVAGATSEQSATATSSPGNRRIPQFNATCGDGIEVHADEGGPIFINGKEADLKKFNDNFYEAKEGQITLSLSFNPDESIILSFNGPNRSNGVCAL